MPSPAEFPVSSGRARRIRSPLACLAAALALAATTIAYAPGAAGAAPRSLGLWSPTASMNQGREGGGGGEGTIAAVLRDGRVLYAGGFAAQGGMLSFQSTNYLRSSELYSPRTGSWTTTGSMGQSRFGAAVALLRSGKVLAAGGYGGLSEGSRSSAELYDPKSGTWSPTQSMSDCRFLGASVALGRDAASELPRIGVAKLMVIGGRDCNLDATGSAEIFDSATQTWQRTADMSVGRVGESATLLLDGRVLVAGGATGGAQNATALASAEIYDPVSNTWTATGSMHIARGLHSAGLLPSGKVIVTGGKCGSSCVTASAEIYDPATGTWSMTASLSAPRLFSASLTLTPQLGFAERLFLVAGGGMQATAEAYDETTATWKPAGTMNELHDDAQLVPIAPGKLLIAGGFSVTGTTYNDTAAAELFQRRAR